MNEVMKVERVSNRDTDQLLTIQELSEYLRVHPCTIRIWVKESRIRAYGQGRILRFEKTDVLRSLQRNAYNADADRSLKIRLRQKHQP
jgi:excisionase family DNA binding protein